MSDEFFDKTKAESEEWLQVAIDKEYINYQRYSTFENVEKIGEGAMGEVFKATSSCYGTTVALKRFTKFTINEIINELRQHKTVGSHENILKFYGITTLEHPPSLKQNQLMLIIEYADGGTLRQYLCKNFENIGWDVKLKFAKQIASAVCCLHENEIVHKNLHSENIFIHKNNIKIGDFCLSERNNEKTNSLLNIFGPVRYSDPEYLYDQKYTRDKKSDIYSIGMLFWEISSGRVPFESEQIDGKLALSIIQGRRETFVDGTPSKYFETYEACWNKDSNCRPTIKKVIEDLNNVYISDTIPINIEENIISSSNQLQADNQKNKYVIKNIATIKEGILREFIEEFVNQLYFKSRLPNNVDTLFKEFNPVWLKILIEKKNIDSEKLLKMMLKHNKSNIYFTSYIGYFYQHGIGTEVIDEQKSLAYYFQSILYSVENHENNSLEIINQSIGQYFLAICYNEGKVVSKDINKMFEFGIKSAQLENVFAQLNISCCYYLGYGVNENKQEAFKWLLTSAENGNRNAQYEIAACYYDGKYVERNEEKAFEWYLKSAENGSKNAQYEIATYYNDDKYVERNEEKAFEWYLKSAENGNFYAQYEVAKCYYDGVGIGKNGRKAFEWYLKSAESENSDAQYGVAVCYEYGIGIGLSEQKAFEWYLKSAENGNSYAQYEVANYYDGINIKEYEQKAFNWYLKSAENGNSNAQYKVANRYNNGKGIEKNEQKAFEWFLRSAENENSSAQYEVANCYNNGIGIEKNKQKAFEWFLKFVGNENENSNAQYEIANCYSNGLGIEKNEQKAFEWYLKSAENENSSAQYEVANCYNNGIGIDEKNVQKAFEWYLASAENEDQRAQYKVANCYYDGIGTEKNEQKAFEWYLKSAKNKNSSAQYEVANCYFKGIGTEKNEQEVFEWFLKSAENGNSNAQYEVSNCYKHGIGIEKNEQEAFNWFLKSAENGSKKAKEFYLNSTEGDFI